MYKFAKKVANHEGFTLVELIVVIAILGILAGIAIPVYSGYIKKANQAADVMLLGAVNTAVAAARADNNYAYDFGPGAKLVITDKCITGITPDAVTLADGTTPDALLAASFSKYFGTNSATALKYCDSDDDFAFDPEKQTFSIVGVGSGSSASSGATLLSHEGSNYTFMVNGEEVTFVVDDQTRADILASTFGTNMSTAELMDDVSGMVDSLQDALNSGAMIKTLLQAQGFTMEQLGISEDDTGDVLKEKLSNAMVLLVAKNTNTANMGQVSGAISAGQSTLNSAIHLKDYTTVVPGEGETLSDNDKKNRALTEGIGELTMNMAGFYSVATAYAHSDAAASWTKTVDGKTYNAKEYYNYVNGKIAQAANATGISNYDKVQGVADAMALLGNLMYEDGSLSTAYSTYASDQLTKDITGMVSGMSAITGNTNALISSGAVNSGYNTGVIADILAAILGK